MEKLLQITFQSDPARLKMVRERVQQVAENIGCQPKFINDLVIAVNEACMNIIQHAYKGDSSGEIVLEIINNGAAIVVQLTDFADPIDTSSVRPRDVKEIRPGGLGTYFIREIMDEFEYGHLDDRGGNVLKMSKKLDQRIR